jgi:hypothetical protein
MEAEIDPLMLRRLARAQTGNQISLMNGLMNPNFN